MSFMIRWTTRLSREERRRLQVWLDRVGAKRAGAVERCPGALIARRATPEAAHSFAALTMAVIGRPVFAYTLEPLDERAEAQAAA